MKLESTVFSGPLPLPPDNQLHDGIDFHKEIQGLTPAELGFSQGFGSVESKVTGFALGCILPSFVGGEGLGGRGVYDLNSERKKEIMFIKSSVPDLWRFDMDPDADPGICNTGLRIQILLLSSVAFMMPTENGFEFFSYFLL